MTTHPAFTTRKSRLIPLCVTLVLALGAGAASAADRATCKVIVGLLKATDKGLEDTALGQAGRSPTSGIATYARQAQEFADQFSTRDPLPEEISAALSAMAEAADAHYFIADAAPALLGPALIIQQAMPQICDGVDVPDLARHGE
ncbi:hypothetical protein [Phaeovulum sp. NW3]|uniref:hypothetical protein n=1 Tax=Phaeovulum sp. NW3 TaxID=2934933 RepID=UPI0020218337|nr:hypothetical protein [Phaeovulum sp. NW3]MCL7466724.1 hypothetical protein [Phaeovulum sp. NW3]